MLTLNCMYVIVIRNINHHLFKEETPIKEEPVTPMSTSSTGENAMSSDVKPNIEATQAATPASEKKRKCCKCNFFPLYGDSVSSER